MKIDLSSLKGNKGTLIRICRRAAVQLRTSA